MNQKPLPCKTTQIERIKAELLKGKEIDSVIAFETYRITRLSAIIERLRKKGFPITAKKKGNGLAVYSLPEEARNRPMTA
ncbi:helix-turn-helix domain-containing protein [Methylicorpusculum sp.]|uniref:helix-turn-helix domain-containing protein n=1 Tax=Methylicorpusculum sp. TaxID=2713644 RepID=UPI002ABA64D8|nr:helix-turn-helix domain-containing protein [Methylicorpusculum sp.]MDZ4153743.1 helix-turn-helix domain-containing protein [Methylicorpusculum sp.]